MSIKILIHLAKETVSETLNVVTMHILINVCNKTGKRNMAWM